MDANKLNLLIAKATLEGGSINETVKTAVSNAFQTVFVEKNSEDFMGMVDASLQTVLAYSKDQPMIDWFVSHGVEF